MQRYKAWARECLIKSFQPTNVRSEISPRVREILNSTTETSEGSYAQ